MIVLVGFMGAGKSTVGRLLATRLGLPFTDVDEVVERTAGMSIAALWERFGEAGFRERERSAGLAALGGPDGVVALGGGALGDPGVASALGGATVVHLDVSPEEALARVGDGAARPLLATTDPAVLLQQRRPGYAAAAGVTVTTDGRAPEEVADEIAARPEILRPRDTQAGPRGRSSGEAVRRIPVATAGGSYDVVVGPGALARLGSLLPDLAHAESAFVVTQGALAAPGAAVCSALEERGLPSLISRVPDGEAAKSLATAERLYATLAGAAAHRHDVVVALGGGAVTDVAGFVAATFARGMPLVNLPTTLLGQVDAAIGGKNGVNLPAAKNQVGTIHQPVAVIADIELLDSLPDAEIRSGMAEVVKYGLIADPPLLDLVTARARDVLRRDRELLTAIVTRSAAIKAAIVGRDERDRGERAWLNYGHTFGHAIEHAGGFGGLRHGEAVALGMMAAAYLARELGRIDDDVVTLHKRSLAAQGLPVSAALDLRMLERTWRHDKKYQGGVRFVLLEALGRPETGVPVPRAALERVVERMKE